MADSDGDPAERGARKFFAFAREMADLGHYEYAIELYIRGLGMGPDALDGHRALREVALKRKAGGGKAMGLMDRAKLPKAKDDKQAMLNAAKQLAYDPLNSDRVAAVLTHASRAGLDRTAAWAAELLRRMNGR